jgi:hypothetical protein
LLAKSTPHNVNLGSGRFAMFNNERDIPGAGIGSWNVQGCPIVQNWQSFYICDWDSSASSSP